MSVERWIEEGLLSREIRVYNEILDEFDMIYLVTYGENDCDFSDDLHDNIEVVNKPRSIFENRVLVAVENLLFGLSVPITQRSLFRDASFIKTNQMRGALVAAWGATIHSITLVVRTGYVLSRFKRQKGLVQFLWALAIEYISYNIADVIFAPSNSAKEYINDMYSPNAEIVTIYNYVDMDKFRELSIDKYDCFRVCYVGRLTEQKNLSNLIRALSVCDVPATFIGDGELKDDLVKLSDDLDVNVEFAGRVPNDQLPQILNKHHAFILPSYYEGMPKSLLEAMACGMPVIGSNVPGNREVITCTKNGILCDTDFESLAAAIELLKDNQALRSEIGSNAREYCNKNHSLQAVYKKELGVYKKYEI